MKKEAYIQTYMVQPQTWVKDQECYHLYQAYSRWRISASAWFFRHRPNYNKAWTFMGEGRWRLARQMTCSIYSVLKMVNKYPFLLWIVHSSRIILWPRRDFLRKIRDVIPVEDFLVALGQNRLQIWQTTKSVWWKKPIPEGEENHKRN